MTYRDSSRPASERVADLLARMTLEEKAAQLGSVLASELMGPDGLEPAHLTKYVGHGIGQVTRLAGRTALDRATVADVANGVQHYLCNETRLGIPAVVHEECLHGYMVRDGTMFAQSLGLAMAWDPELVRAMGEVIADQMRAAGAHLGLGPVLDVARDPRWGRIEETFGEDPHLVSVLGLALTEGLQHHGDGTGILATAKHFAGHGSPEGGRNAASPHFGAREFAEVYLPPFEQAVRHGRVGAVMHAYHDLDGIPCIANRWLLTELLRDQWGFDGTIVSDYNGVEELVDAHRVVADYEAAAVASLQAGLDVELPETSAFGEPLLRAVRSGRLAETEVDLATARVLTQKFALGLFDHPFVDAGRVTVHDERARSVAVRSAVAAVTCVQNRNGLLPLSPEARVAVIGPNADDARALAGDYSHVAHQELLAAQKDDVDAFDRPVPKHLELRPDLEGVDSVLDGLVGLGVTVDHVPGCTLTGDDTSGLPAAVAAARGADVALVVVGERSGLTPECTTGESRDRVDLDLPGVQQQLLEAVAATGTPVVLLVISGRPNTLAWAAEHVDAILWSVPPGEAGGTALAEILLGRLEPEGRLPVTVPRHVGQIPIHYAHNPSSVRSRWWGDYVDESHRPQWCFGHGLGYTTFAVGGLSGPRRAATTDEVVTLRAEVTNTGDRPGTTVLQVFAEQAAASVVRPARRLIWFRRLRLEPGVTAPVEIEVPLDRLALLGRDMARVVEAGTVTLAVGQSADDLPCRLDLRLDGDDHPVPAAAPAR